MRSLLALLLTIVPFVAYAQRSLSNDTIAPPAAEQNAARPKPTIDAGPKQSAEYNTMASELIHKAEETSNPRYYAEAANVIKSSLAASPNNFEGQKLQASVLLGEHQYPAALELAQTLNKRVPDDVMVYGLLTDANMQLGNYEDAERAAQWMLNLRPGNVPGLTRAASLRELFGDVEGAEELMGLALQADPLNDGAHRAAMLARMSHLRLLSGKTDAAEHLSREALTALPNYSPALESMAEVRTAQGRYEDAATLFSQRYQISPSADSLFDWAEALERAGHGDEARKRFAEFESQAVTQLNGKDNSNRKLVFYYADYSKQPSNALTVAEREYSWRKDVYTIDAYAWALHVNGRDSEALKQMEKALGVGVRDPQMLLHAGEIAVGLGNTVAGARYLKQSIDLRVADSEQARLTLARISKSKSADKR